ncbi:MAG: THUMP domain-containing protein [Candidatus Hadarchaeota archaeon]
MRTVIVRYGEIALKSEPVRRWFEGRLISNIRQKLYGVKHSLRVVRGRIFIDLEDWKKVLKPLSMTPGVVSASVAVRTSSDIESVRATAVGVAKKVLGRGKSFAVRTSREGSHPYTSQQVNSLVGAEILAKVKGAKVNLSAPDKQISIEIRGSDAYVFTDVLDGAGGLPVGSQGKVSVVFSGRPKDLVSAFLMLKRGCDSDIFVPSFESNGCGRGVLVAKKLLLFHPGIKIWALPCGEVLKSVKKAPSYLRFYLFQRAVVRVAEFLAKRVGAESLVVGDGLAEVGSQGLGGIRLIDSACRTQVFRPVALMEEKEIGEIASRAGIKLPRDFGHPFSVPKAIPDESTVKNAEDDFVPAQMIKNVAWNARRVKVGVKDWTLL